MARFDNPYSTFIAWLKIILPFGALALLSTLFLFSERTDPTASIPFSTVDINEVVREKRMTNPVFSSVTENGSSVTLAAAVAKPDQNNSEIIFAEDVVSSLIATNGDRIDLDAHTATVNGTNQNAVLSGGASISTNTGYTIETREIQANLTDNRLETSDSITATGPLGSIVAGKMIVTSPEQSGSFHLLFKDGVNIVYSPQN